MLENIRSLLTPEILSRVAGDVDEPESAVMKGYSAAIPAIAGTIAQRADDRGFVRDLADLATSTAADPNAIASAAGAAFSTTGEGSMTVTDNWLSSLFGRNLSGLADSIARFASIRGSAAASILSSAAPVVLTCLGRWIRRDNLSPGQLAQELRNNRSQIEAAMPAGFDVPSGLRAPVDATMPYIPRASDTTGLNVPALILLGMLGLGGMLWWGVQAYHQRTQASIGRGISTLVGTSGTVNDVITRTLPGNVSVKFARGSIEDALSSYLASPIKGSAAFEFNRIGFETGSGTLTPLSHEQLENVAAILNAYPTASVTVEGFTDNVGEESSNLALSRARAESVAGALVADGVPAGRVRSEGFGSQKPIASNATEFGRSQNRRVMLDVIAR
jgi:outer membrane protein OmpA-like peptidoglycan-associated protein